VEPRLAERRGTSKPLVLFPHPVLVGPPPCPDDVTPWSEAKKIAGVAKRFQTVLKTKLKNFELDPPSLVRRDMSLVSTHACL
jgi:hypothetical protein